MISFSLNGRTLGHLAANCPNQAMLPFLYACTNIDLKQRDEIGRTLISYASQSGNHLTTEWLLRKGADPLLADERKNIPLHFVNDITTKKSFCFFALKKNKILDLLL